MSSNSTQQYKTRGSGLVVPAESSPAYISEETAAECGEAPSRGRNDVPVDGEFGGEPLHKAWSYRVEQESASAPKRTYGTDRGLWANA